MHIGLFDSGVGGLTVLTELKRHLPNAHFSYLGDTARLPYGNKAPETLLRYTLQNIRFLENLKVDAIVVACHSASSVCLNLTKTDQGTPLYNVIAPSCQEACSTSKSKNIGVMATKATTRSQAYPRFISNLDSSVQVHSQECPLLVPLVEEGLLEGEITEIILKDYLKSFKHNDVDTILLGCTHYPLLSPEIQRIAGTQVQLINPAQSVAKEIQKIVKKAENQAQMDIYLTDQSPHFISHARSLLGEQHHMSIQQIDLV